MEDAFVGQLTSAPVQTIDPAAPVPTAATRLLAEDIRSLVVTDANNQSAGILTATDCVRVVADEAATPDTAVGEYATPVETTASVNDSLQAAATLLMDNEIHHVPVEEPDQGLVGILTATDLTAFLSPDWTPSPAE